MTTIAMSAEAMSAEAISAEAMSAEIVSFWRDAGPDKWFEKDEAFDRDIATRFLATHEAASRCELASWQESAEGALALLILLDQFPRNMFRNSAHAFATDPLARAIADHALAHGFDHATEHALRQFFYLPFMHSEVLADQDRCLQLYEKYGDANTLKFANIHRDIVLKFGRFPHRNGVLGRVTTPAEDEFLRSGGFAG
jgi:uncharacterized protein (DUF924 family)